MSMLQWPPESKLSVSPGGEDLSLVSTYFRNMKRSLIGIFVATACEARGKGYLLNLVRILSMSATSRIIAVDSQMSP